MKDRKEQRSKKRLKAIRLVRWGIRGMLLVTVGMACLWFGFPLSTLTLEQWPSSPMVTDRNGKPLLWQVGADDQWRLPRRLSELSSWLAKATVAVEDERFFSHPGVDPIAVCRAAMQNMQAGHVVSGASTLTMQVCRMMEPRPRSFKAKCIEAFRALQLDAKHTKAWILETYLNIAPYGGNIRGVEAAARRYFSVSSSQLTLGEAALIAGIPQSPEQFRPDRCPEPARARRDLVLHAMWDQGVITREQHDEAMAETVVLNLYKNPDPSAFHLAWWALEQRPNGGRTTLDLTLQEEVERLTVDHIQSLPTGSQTAVVVLEIESGEVLALVGSADPGAPVDGQVNGALAFRSPGSTLKPFVYATAFEAGRLSPESVVYDLPIERAGWNPTNFDKNYYGELTATEALQRSLNIPAILVAEQVGLERCIGLMEGAGIRFHRSAVSRGGLAVVVGAVEVRLLELVNAYATVGRQGVRCTVRLFADDAQYTAHVLNPNVCHLLDDILSSHARQPRGMEQGNAGDMPWFMWKTGTSSGRRDAWAVGHNRKFAVGVWAGKFSGSGDAAFVGAAAAEPLLARLFNMPELRTTIAPPRAASLLVHHPLHPPLEVSGQSLRILSPAEGASFVAVAGETRIRPAVNQPCPLTWFLNGTLIEFEPPLCLDLESGGYELRCVNESGLADSVRFTVQ